MEERENTQHEKVWCVHALKEFPIFEAVINQKVGKKSEGRQGKTRTW
jgi:hypothetical protein